MRSVCYNNFDNKGISLMENILMVNLYKASVVISIAYSGGTCRGQSSWLLKSCHHDRIFCIVERLLRVKVVKR